MKSGVTGRSAEVSGGHAGQAEGVGVGRLPRIGHERRRRWRRPAPEVAETADATGRSTDCDPDRRRRAPAAGPTPAGQAPLWREQSLLARREGLA